MNNHGIYDWSQSPIMVLEDAGFTLDEWQRHVLLQSGPRQLIIAPRQSGKSTVAAAKLLSEACRIHPSGGKSVLVVGPSQRQANQLLDRCRDLVRRANCAVKIVGDREDRLRLSSGTPIRAYPDNADTICGNTTAFLLLEEGARISAETWRTALASTVACAGGAWAISTGTDETTEFFSATKTWPTTRVDWRQCPRLSAEVIAEMRATMPSGVFKAEFEAGFYEAETRLVFEEEIPVGTEVDHLGPAFGGIDWGFRDPTAALWGVLAPDGRLLLQGELYEVGMGIDEIARRIPKRCIWFSDPAAARERYELMRRGFSVRKAENAIETGFREIAWAIKQGRLSMVEDACPNLRREMSQLKWRLEQRTASASRRTPFTHGDDHALAALRYLVLGVAVMSPRRPPAPAAWNLWTDPNAWTVL